MKRALIVPLALVLFLPFLLAPIGEPPRMPEPTGLGTFEGTWFYVDPGFSIAIFISRDKGGPLRLRYHVRDKSGTEFETDAGGYAKYLDSGNLVDVLFTGGATSDDRIEGHHERTTRTKKETVHESSDFQMFRTERGKKIVLHYDDWKVEVIDAAGKTRPADSQKDLFRIFRKASEQVIGFEEIPF